MAELRSSLEAELQESNEHRSSRASDASLAGAIEKVRQAELHLQAGDQAAAAQSVDEVSHQAIDSWSLTSPVTEKAAECAQRLRRSVS